MPMYDTHTHTHTLYLFWHSRPEHVAVLQVQRRPRLSRRVWQECTV